MSFCKISSFPWTSWLLYWLTFNRRYIVYNFWPCFSYVRMDVKHYQMFVNMLCHHCKSKTLICEKMSSKMKCCCFMLRYLASGKSYRSLEYQFRISRKAISYIFDEPAKATVEILEKEFLNWRMGRNIYKIHNDCLSVFRVC